jgi:MFS family permease
MLLNLSPLKNSRNFRLLYIGQVISFLGSMISYTALPYQVYMLTKSSFLVGMIGSVQLAPLVLTGLYGGALADSMDRRKLLVIAELLLCLACGLLIINSILESPSLVLIFVAAGSMSAFVGLHRPSMEALNPQIVNKEDLTSIAALNSFRYSIGAIIGPALGGLIIAQFGLTTAYSLDLLTFFVSLICLYNLKDLPQLSQKSKASISSIKEGIRYAMSKPELVGTYLVDIIAMVFAMPIALFPALAENWGGAKSVGLLYSAMPIGSLFLALFSGRSKEIKRHGAAVILSATGWGVAIIGLAFAGHIYAAIFFLALAGASDAVSALYRSTIWNETVPANYRGRLAGLEMLSYMTGPLLGNMRAGFMASEMGNFNSIFIGGVLCVVACLACIWIFPKFWSYNAETATNSEQIA